MENKSSSNTLNWKILAWWVVNVLAVYYSERLAHPPGIFPSFWPPAGLGLFLLYRFGIRFWPILWSADFIGNAPLLLGAKVSRATYIPGIEALIPSFGSATGETIEAVIIILLINKLNLTSKHIEPARLFKIGVLILPLGCIVGAVLAVGASAWKGTLVWTPVWVNIVIWSLADLLAILLITPFLYSWVTLGLKSLQLDLRSISKGVLLLVSCSLTAWLAFGDSLNVPVSIYFLLATSLLLQLLWATSAYALHGTSTILMIISCVAVLGTAYGYGPFGSASKVVGTLELQFFLILVSVTALLQSLYLQENRRMAKQLSQSKELVEKELRERTRYLLKEINEKNSAKEEMKQERDFSNTILETIGSLVIILDSDGNLIRMNPASENATGFKSNEVLGKKFWDLFFVEEEIPNIKETFLQLRSGKYPIQYEAVWKTKNGDLRWIVWSNTCVSHSGKPIELIVGTGLDITERKLAERELRRKDEQLRLALQAGNMGGWYWSLPGDSIQWFGSIKEILGIEKEGLVGTIKEFLELVHPMDRLHVQHAFQKSLLQGADFQIQFRKKPKDGELSWIQSHGRILYGEVHHRPIGLAGVIMDISERKKLEEQRSRLLTDTLRAVKQREEFINVASHELRTPLTPLKMHLDILKRSLTNPEGKMIERERLKAIIFIADKQMNDLIRLVDTLLDISRIRLDRFTLKKRLTDLSGIIQNSAMLVNKALQKSPNEIRLKLEPHIIGNWDSGRLEQVFTNLISNAVKYGLGNPITISTVVSAEWVRIDIEDQGIGIASEDHKRIFEQFERAISSEKYGGLGLGLFISRKIVLAHRGEIFVESQIGKGSKFTVILPLAERLTRAA